jgi:hypothetical protein
VAGRPILEHILRGLKAAGIGEAAVVVGHLGEQIEAHFGGGAGLGMALGYRRQTRLDGTARAALLARDLLQEEPFVLTWGDILTDWANYRRLLETFRADPCDALLGLNEVDDPAAGAAVYREGDRVSDIVEKPPPGTSSPRPCGPSSRGSSPRPGASTNSPRGFGPWCSRACGCTAWSSEACGAMWAAPRTSPPSTTSTPGAASPPSCACSPRIHRARLAAHARCGAA